MPVNRSPGKKKRAGLWVRMLNIDVQFGIRRKYFETLMRTRAASEGWRVAAVYDGYTDDDELLDAPELHRMFRDVREGRINILMAESLERLTPYTKNLAVIFAELGKYEVPVVFLEQHPMPPPVSSPKAARDRNPETRPPTHGGATPQINKLTWVDALVAGIPRENPQLLADSRNSGVQLNVPHLQTLQRIARGLHAFMDDDGLCFPPSRREFSQLLRMSRAALDNVFNYLMAAGWLEEVPRFVSRGKAWKRKVYRVTIPEQHRSPGGGERKSLGQ